jgi:hypothetical protein
VRGVREEQGWAGAIGLGGLLQGHPVSDRRHDVVQERPVLRGVVDGVSGDAARPERQGGCRREHQRGLEWADVVAWRPLSDPQSSAMQTCPRGSDGPRSHVIATTAGKRKASGCWANPALEHRG